MDLIINKVVELEVVHIAYCYRAVELLARTSVCKLCLAVLTHRDLGEVDLCRILILVVCALCFCLFKASSDIGFMSTVKYRGHYLPVKCLTSITEVYFKYLTDIHTRRNAEGVQYYIKRSTIGEERHIFLL